MGPIHANGPLHLHRKHLPIAHGGSHRPAPGRFGGGSGRRAGPLRGLRWGLRLRWSADVAGDPPTALERRGIDPDGTSKRLTPEMIANADLVLGMTEAHVEAARHLAGPGLTTRRSSGSIPMATSRIRSDWGRTVYDRVADRLDEVLPGSASWRCSTAAGRDSRDAGGVARAAKERTMRIVLGCDHRGRQAIDELLPYSPGGHEAGELGATSARAVQRLPRQVRGSWPTRSARRSRSRHPGLRHGHRHVHRGQQGRGGEGGPRPGRTQRRLSRSHNDANILCMSADMLGQTLLRRIVETWMETPSTGDDTFVAWRRSTRSRPGAIRDEGSAGAEAVDRRDQLDRAGAGHAVGEVVSRRTPQPVAPGPVTGSASTFATPAMSRWAQGIVLVDEEGQEGRPLDGMGRVASGSSSGCRPPGTA